MIRINNLSKVYSSKEEKPVQALTGVNLFIPSKGFIAITGASGCGKTTLLNVIAGFEKATEGEVIIDGLKLGDCSEKELDDYRLKNLGFIFQDYNLIDVLTVRENVELPLKMLGLSEEIISSRSNQILEKLELEELADKSVLHLSGGQKQRVSIAQATVKKPKLILADEPTGNLDEENSRIIFGLLKDISKECTVLVVTHDKALAEEYADGVLNIVYGRIEKNEVLNSEETEQCVDKHKSVSVKLPRHVCFKLANKLIEKRSWRATVTVMILMITLTMVYVLTMIDTRQKGKSISKYLESTYSDVVNVYRKLDGAESELSEFNTEVSGGKKLKEEIEKIVGVNSVVFADSATTVHGDNRLLFDYFGDDSFAKQDGEGCINKRLARQIGVTKGDLPFSVTINNSEIVITEIIDSYYVVGREEGNVLIVSKATWIDIAKKGIDRLCGISVLSRFGPGKFAATEKRIAEGKKCASTLIYGRLPEKKNEIVVPEQDILLHGMEPEQSLGMSFELYNLSESRYGNAFSGTLNLYDYCGPSVSIVGISSESYYCFSDEVYDAIISDAVFYKCKYAIVIDSEKISTTAERLLDSEIYFDDKSLDLLYQNWDGIDDSMGYLRYALAALVFLTVLQMISMFSFSISDSRKIIGTLRAMGVNGRNIGLIYLCENLLVTIVAAVLSIVASLGIITGLNNHYIRHLFMNESIISVIPNMGVVLISCVLSVLVSLTGILIPLYRLNRTSISKLLRE